MPNIATVLKDEITRLARKELRIEVEALKKSSSRYRSEIAALKRRAVDLEKEVARLSKNGSSKDGSQKSGSGNGHDMETESAGKGIRFSARSLQSQRRRLGLSAREMGILLGVSEQTIYNWEAEKARPRPKHIPVFAATRSMSRDDALVRIQEAA